MKPSESTALKDEIAHEQARMYAEIELIVRSHVLPIGDNVDYSRGWEACRRSIELDLREWATPRLVRPNSD